MSTGGGCSQAAPSSSGRRSCSGWGRFRAWPGGSGRSGPRACSASGSWTIPGCWWPGQSFPSSLRGSSLEPQSRASRGCSGGTSPRSSSRTRSSWWRWRVPRGSRSSRPPGSAPRCCRSRSPPSCDAGRGRSRGACSPRWEHGISGRGGSRRRSRRSPSGWGSRHRGARETAASCCKWCAEAWRRPRGSRRQQRSDGPGTRPSWRRPSSRAGSCSSRPSRCGCVCSHPTGFCARRRSRPPGSARSKSPWCRRGWAPAIRPLAGRSQPPSPCRRSRRASRRPHVSSLACERCRACSSRPRSVRGSSGLMHRPRRRWRSWWPPEWGRWSSL